MPEVNSPAPGQFCWIELGTTDPEAAKGFYAELFGWNVNVNDMGAMGKYSIFRKGDRDAAAMYGLMAEQKAQGVPSNWMTYIGVTSADDAVAKAAELGGSVMQPPFDVMDFGRMAVLKDPQGAVFSVWEAKTHWGVTIRDEANTLCWNELATNDPAAAAGFYTKLTGWTAKESPEYTEWNLDGKAIGGMRTIKEGEPAPPSWMPYFMVDDCDAMTAKAQSGGGTACVEPLDMPGVGRFSVLIDPQGAVFALYEKA
jgi:hypothetical protein